MKKRIHFKIKHECGIGDVCDGNDYEILRQNECKDKLVHVSVCLEQ